MIDPIVWIDCQGRQYQLSAEHTGKISIKVHYGTKDINTVTESNSYVACGLQKRISMQKLNKKQCTQILQVFKQVIEQKMILKDEFQIRDGCASPVKHGPSGKFLNLVKEVTLILPKEKYEQILKTDV